MTTTRSAATLRAMRRVLPLLLTLLGRLAHAQGLPEAGGSPGETPGESLGETPGESLGETPGESLGETPGESPVEPPGETPGGPPGEPEALYGPEPAPREEAFERSVDRARIDEIKSRFMVFRGSPIRAVQVVCDLPDCGDPARIPVFKRLTRLDGGMLLRPEDVAEAWTRLMSTQLFRRLEVEAEPLGNDVLVRFRGEVAVVITDLRIEYDRLESRLYPQQFRSEVRKRLLFRRGGPFPAARPDGTFAPEDEALLASQRHKITDLYERQGYEGTRVEIVPRYHGPQGKEVRVTLRVHEGDQPEIGELLIHGNRAFTYSQIAAEVTTGERVDFWRQVFGAFGVGRYAQRELKEQLKTVEAMYREAGYVAARVRQEGAVRRKGGKVFPLIKVREGPRVTVSFNGNDSLDDEVLAGVLTFRESGALDDTEIEASVEAIRIAYQEVARYYVEVTARAERTPGRVHITFTIEEGPQVYVRSVDLIGPRTLEADTLRDLMETRGVAEGGVINSFVASAGVPQDARITNDLLNLRDFYFSQGFLGFRFRCADPRMPVATWTATRLLELSGAAAEDGPMLDPAFFAGRFDLWSDDPIKHRCFLLEPDADPRLVTLHVELSEGPRTTVDRVVLDRLLAGMDAEMQDEAWGLLATLGFYDEARQPIRGAGLNPKKIQAVRSFLLRYFHRAGYLSAEVTPVCFRESGGARVGSQGDRSDCTAGRLYGAHLARLQFEVEAGPRTEVDGVLVQGNLSTDDDIIRHELLLEDGGALGTEALFRSQANLRSLGLFDAASVTTLGRIEGGTRYAHANRSTVQVTIEEGRYILIDTVLGLQIASSPLTADDLPVLYTLGASVRHRNPWGRAIEVGAGFNHANRLDNPQDVSNDEASWQLGPFLKDRRLFGTRLDLTLESPLEQGQTAQRDAYQQAIAPKAVVGYDFYNLSYPADWGQGLRTTWTLELGYERRRPLTRAGERPAYGDFDAFLSLGPALIWERRDNALHPTRGWFTSVQTEVVSSEITVDPIISYKLSFTGQYVLSFFERRLILAPTVRLGSVFTDEAEADLPADFLFKAGGDSVALPVRGYADASIEACGGRNTLPGCSAAFAADDEDQALPLTVGGRTLVAGSFEVRVPTFVVDDFWLAAFTDFAAIAPHWENLRSDSLYPSVGGGLRWLVTGQIPLRLDVGVPLRENPFSPREPRLHLNIFYTL